MKRQNIAGRCQQTFENKKFVGITQQCFALLPQVNFPTKNLNVKAFCAGVDLNDLMALGSVVNDDELDTARKSIKLLTVIKKFQGHHMEIEKVESSHKIVFPKKCSGT